MIREVNESDIPFIKVIYNYYIKNTIVTFEENEIDDDETGKRIIEITKDYPWIVWEEDNQITGYAYASRWKARTAYKHSAEVTVYVDKRSFGKGIGSKLLDNLINKTKEKNIHCLIGGIALPNQASKALFEKFRFTKCAEFKEVGFKFGKWIDVGYWQKVR